MSLIDALAGAPGTEQNTPVHTDDSSLRTTLTHGDPGMMMRPNGCTTTFERLRGILMLFLTSRKLDFLSEFIGVDDIISSIPFYGDFLGIILATYMILLCWMFGVPSPILIRMVVNVMIDGLIGIIPILGDVLDALFKANLRNLAILEDWLLKGDHKYSIQVTPDDEFLPSLKNSTEPKHKPKSMNAGGTGGPSFGRGGGRRRWNDSANAATNGGGTHGSKGTYRFSRADLNDGEVNLDLD